MRVTNPGSTAVVIGAGIGGLTAAAVLARAGMDVTVLEAQVYLGGCAGTFYHQGYRFEVGATLAGGFYPGGPMDLVAQAAGIDGWLARSADPVMVVHMPDGATITRFGDERRHEEQLRAFGRKSLAFWEWQEKTADAIWNLALRAPPWPPQTPAQFTDLAVAGLRWLAGGHGVNRSPSLLADAFSTVSSHLVGQTELMRLFVDAQLLISAQTTSQYANALYGAAALDLPRRGVVHLEGGIETVSRKLAGAVIESGGMVITRQEVSRIVTHQGKAIGVETKKGDFYPAQTVIANLPPANIAALLGKEEYLSTIPDPSESWGAFMVYMGIDEHVVPPEFTPHHQIISNQPVGEGNTVFLSISPSWDSSRAPIGKRALTLSTHTDLRPWWQLHKTDPERFQARKQAYLEKLLRSAEGILPGIMRASELIMPGTPVTFQKFTRRSWGMVGGFPQTSLFRAKRPNIGAGIWMVGDSIFPGQSLPAVALGGLRIAGLVVREEIEGRQGALSSRRKKSTHELALNG